LIYKPFTGKRTNDQALHGVAGRRDVQTIERCAVAEDLDLGPRVLGSPPMKAACVVPSITVVPAVIVGSTDAG